MHRSTAVPVPHTPITKRCPCAGPLGLLGVLGVIATACSSGSAAAGRTPPTTPAPTAQAAPAPTPSTTDATTVPPTTPPSTSAAGSTTETSRVASAPEAAQPPVTLPSSTTAPAPAPTTTAPVPTKLSADESEYNIALSSTQFHAGGYTITAVNKGQATHNLVITGPGINSQQTPLLAPGQSATLRVTLQPGGYELYCGVDGHRQLGMDVHITVS